ncbi:hypothetical protein LAZ67_11001974, partial [Cordylochernes scorpioides]
MADQPVSSAELKKLRTPVRARFTKAFNELETEIKKKEVKKADVEKILRRLQTHHEKLSILNMRMEEALLRESASEDIFTAEYESVCEYEDNFSNIMTDYEALEEKDDVSTISGTAAMNYRLPKLEFKNFGGEPREWTTFWSQFSTINRDPQMPPETKFQYLFQATAENSEAREAVESFPPSADNYPKVIEYIKSRFGEDEMLVEIYVRDLLQNVHQNVRAEGKMSVVKLYDRLETQLRALETLGVARDKFAAMLYPLVESALPEDTLRVWERSQYTVSGRGVQDKLTQLMTFLKTEVKGESRVNMAKAAFKIDNNQDAKDDRSNRKSLSKKNTGSKMPTATDLANTTHMRNNCIFCGNGHPSQECYSGQRMHLPEKKDKAKGKNVCFWYLLPGHGFKKCRIKPRCPVCGGKHYPIMCPNLEAQKTSHLQKAELKVSRESPATKQETANQFTSTTLNNATVGGVYLQTLIVKISGPKGKHNVRVLLDCGSQRSYISKRMVDALGLKRVQQVTLTHNLFGGGEIRQKKHNVYKVNVSSLNNEYMDDIKFLDQEVICGHISQVQDHTILNELKARGINLTDICQGEEISIHMLIGSDLLSSILTGRMQILQNGVVATETKLGWTVMGPAIGKDMEDSCLIVTSFHVNSFDGQDLWKLDVLGIMDAAETKSRKDLIEASNTHFKETVKRDESGRGEHNPADLPSRGESPSKFTNSGWWERPKWLQEKKEDWPVSKVQYDLEAIEEERRKTVVAGFVAKNPEENPWYLNLYEGKREMTLPQILRVIAWMLRFKPSEYKGDIISQEELDSAEKSLVKIIQSESIGEEDAKMKQLHAFQDKEGLWRGKTRIVNRNDDELFRLPILIPTNHPVTELIVKSVHEKMYHCGAQTLRSVLREKFWIPKARQLIRQVIHKCPRCRRFETKRVDVPEASLPQHRVRDVVVFEVTGIDLGGPLYLEDGQKVWFVIFTCGVYRAVHLELVTSLSTEVLVGAVERFVARRGCPAVIYSDNGTNLVGLRNEHYRVNFGVKWKLNPPAAPWWGGWVERIVGLTKKAASKIAGKTCCQLRRNGDDPRKLRFRSEYLGLLVHHDNRKKQRQLKVRDIVLVEVENRKQINWPMGKITKVFPGTDNVRRLVEVKTKSGFMKRAVQRLFPLEVPSEDVEQGDGELKPAEDEIVREKTPGVESVSVQEKTTPIKKMEREEALERLKKKRTILRTSLSKYGKRIEEYDVHKECDHEELLGQLSDVYEELRRVDEEIAYLGGTAAQTVEGFCLSEENYDKAVELLKKRFGKGERLIDVHMNNLLALKPLRVTKDVRAFRELYGRILVQIRSLESLGVVVESYGNLLCPLLLKLLPSDLKLELHREFTGAFSLGDLIEFLERQLIALESTFGTQDEITAGQPSNEHPQSQSSIVKYRRNERNPLPTAAGFLNASEAVNKRKNCAFCERDHESTKCEFAENLTLEDKLGKLKKKGACFRCLKYGHLSKFCKVKTSCTSCGELRYSRIMCPRKNQNATPARGMMRDETLTNLTTPVVLLPTLRVTIRGKCKERMGRILIDTGSQRSYVLQDTAEEMGYECSKKESLRHSLFGGSNTELYEHGAYDIRLSNLDGSYGCNFEALSQDVICDSVPRVHQGKWMQDLSAHDIELTDLHRGPLEILIEADIAGKLLTGEHRRLPSGLVAVQTRLGWTLMGKIPATEEETSVSGLCTTSLLTSDLENLWRLEAIGISDARQDDSIQKETEEYFARTISQDCEGRYQVALPWIRERELLTDNRDVAEKRLANEERDRSLLGHREGLLQIGIREEDRDYLRFLWYDKEGNVMVLRHARVVFGITTSPYLLLAALFHHLNKAPEHWQETAELLRESLYIDNCVASFSKVTDMEKFVDEAQRLLASAHFNLRDWTSNVTSIMCDGPRSDRGRLLGMTWNQEKDTLACSLENLEIQGPINKRKVAGQIGVSESIAIPRWLCYREEHRIGTTLHVFCDASKASYATCIFLRIESEQEVTCQLVQARSRVAPLKGTTIPRLELLACLVGARLVNNVVRDLKFEDMERFYWTDSMNALHWIKGKDNWATFVMNRVMEIRSLSETEDWYHVPGCLNPADLPSRGCLADSLERSKWWEGPSWLRRPRRDWSHREIYPDPDIVNSEKRKIVLTSTCIEREKDQYYYRFSNYYKILRVTAWMNRFLTNARGTIGQRVKGDLTVNEIKRAELMLVRVIQRESFTGPEDKRLKDFKLCCDSLGLLRVKTKISRRQDLESFRMPLLLPSDHDLVYLLIRWKHETWGHVGLQTLMNLLREDYWILKFRRTVRRVIHQCVKCRRFTAKSGSVESVELPENRVRDASIFEVVGIDLTGPLVLRNRRKVWIVIFTCAVYRAVHLELVTSLSTENFLQAFRRFVARRGRPYVVYSDNGTNFRGASRALGNLDNAVVQSESTKQNINWKFIPPSAPWWGGWWERLIGLLKQLLRKILGQARLEFEELYTIICDTESLMNSRPLTYMSEDVEDLSPLTPALFLHDLKEIGVPDLDSIERASLQKRYRFRQRLREDLRKRFRTEYFGFLRQETRRRSKTRPIKVGDLVLIGQDNAKRVNWPLARVVEVYPGRDGPVRVAKLRTSKGVQIRPVQRLYNLEIPADLGSTLRSIQSEPRRGGSRGEANYRTDQNGLNQWTTSRLEHLLKEDNLPPQLKNGTDQS